MTALFYPVLKMIFKKLTVSHVRGVNKFSQECEEKDSISRSVTDVKRTRTEKKL